MRYEKADMMPQLALEMQAAHTGLTLAEIEQRFGVGRGTAMRMRDAILRNPELDPRMHLLSGDGMPTPSLVGRRHYSNGPPTDMPFSITYKRMMEGRNLRLRTAVQQNVVRLRHRQHPGRASRGDRDLRRRRAEHLPQPAACLSEHRPNHERR